jgi:hypothetical protein
MEWLQKDLALVADKSTPIVVAMHIPLYKESLTATSSYELTNGAALVACLSEFSTVHVLTGHAHRNYTQFSDDNRVMEHNVAAVCATWWWTGNTNHAGNHICIDGSVGGYAVWETDNTIQKWYYKSTGYDKNYQFRTYDLNTILITADKYAPNANDTYKAKLAGFAGVYQTPNANNEVLINVFNYDVNWTIEVKEGDNVLPVTRVSVNDPLHIISYEAARLNVNADPTSTFYTNKASHIFQVTASSANSTLNIKVTDRFGNEYTETMTRPKELSCSMR